jgi:hypothetical protein
MRAGDMPGFLGDMIVPGSCSVAGRVCVANLSAECSGNGATPVVDRTCSTSCKDGYCQPPSSMTSCPGACSGSDVCAPFVSNMAFVDYCAPPVGGGGVGAACSTPGPDRTCATGYCVNAPPSGNVCMILCNNPSECPNAGGSCKAIRSPTTIEGVSTSGLKTCF